ncbi:MAG: hypothetical protein PHY93_13890 [Bacteriovorax sp.]|nr:hypothetical protein [Bacteriovorax sp.]
MDQEFRGELKKIEQNFEHMDAKFDKRCEHVDKQFGQIDKKFDRLTTIMMWQGGILVTLISGLYFKLFFI